jgi:hypothetical protein
MDPDPHADCIYEHTDPDGNGWFLYKYSHRHLTMPNHPGPVPPGLRKQLHTPASTVPRSTDCHGHAFADSFRTAIRNGNYHFDPCPLCNADRKDDRGGPKADDRTADTAAKPDDHRDRCAKCDAYHSLGYPEPEPATADPGW